MGLRERDARHGAADTEPTFDGDQICLQMPADPRFARVARVAVSALAVRLGFDVGVVEDLRIAVDEALVLLLRDLPPEPDEGSAVSVVMTLTARVPDLQVELRLDPPPPPGPEARRPTDDDDRDPLDRFAELVPPRVSTSVTRGDGVVRLGLDD
jgi:hypothetical protein